MKIVVYKNGEVNVLDDNLMLEYSHNPVSEVHEVTKIESKLEKKIGDNKLKKSDIQTLKKEGKIT